MSLLNIAFKITTNLFNAFFAILGNKIFKTVTGLLIHNQTMTCIQFKLTIDFGVLLTWA